MSTEKRGTTVELPYEEACRNYTLGFALALFMTASVFASVLIGDFPLGYDRLLTVFWGVFNLGGVFIVALAYHFPVLFYEVMEE